MAQKDSSPAARFIFKVQALLEHPLGLALPGSVLETAARRAFEAGVTPEEAAIRICHEHARLVSRSWVEESRQASDLAEFVIAGRIEDSAKLALQTGLSLLEVLPDLPDYVQQPCFSDEFRDMAVTIAIQDGNPEHRWSRSDGAAGVSRSAGA
jgi:hypothetical protein